MFPSCGPIGSANINFSAWHQKCDTPWCEEMMTQWNDVETLRPKQNGRDYAADILSAFFQQRRSYFDSNFTEVWFKFH